MLTSSWGFMLLISSDSDILLKYGLMVIAEDSSQCHFSEKSLLITLTQVGSCAHKSLYSVVLLYVLINMFTICVCPLEYTFEAKEFDYCVSPVPRRERASYNKLSVRICWLNKYGSLQTLSYSSLSLISSFKSPSFQIKLLETLTSCVQEHK